MSNVLSDFVAKNCQRAERGPVALLFVDGAVVAEEKIRGRRVFLWNSNGRVLMATKHNGVYGPDTIVKGKKVYAQIFREIEVSSGTILDCELWPERSGTGEPTLYVFDILFKDNADVRSKNLSERKALLRSVIKESEHVRILPWRWVGSLEEVKAFKEEVVAKGGEGLVIKADVHYGTPGSWLKDKHEETVDCFVADFGKGAKGETTYFVAVYIEGKQTVLGEVYSAVDGVERSEIKLGTVLEVRFQIHDGELIFPGTILRAREDKTLNECTGDQW